MKADPLVLELARRLTQAAAGSFVAEGETVVPDGSADGRGRLQIIDAGAGRTDQVMRALRHADELPLVPVIAGRHFSGKALAELDEAGANYMDDRHLKVRLAAPSLLIVVRDEAGAYPPARPANAIRLSGAAGGVALALLSDPGRDWKVGDLALGGCASLGTAQNTVVALEAEGLVARLGRGPATRRRLTDRAALLDRYARDALADRRVVARGFLLNNGAEATMRAVSQRLVAEGQGPRAWFTGVAAAQMVAPHVTGVRTFEAWVTAPIRADVVLTAMGAMPADEGTNLTLMQGHKGVQVGSEYRDGVHRVSVFRMYADALADPARGEEQAEYLRETVIGF